jgi:hypothetical protein
LKKSILLKDKQGNEVTGWQFYLKSNNLNFKKIKGIEHELYLIFATPFVFLTH